jgi:hypothetical protein
MSAVLSIYMHIVRLVKSWSVEHEEAIAGSQPPRAVEHAPREPIS